MLALVDKLNNAHGNVVDLLALAVHIPGADLRVNHMSKRFNLEHVINVVVELMLVLDTIREEYLFEV